MAKFKIEFLENKSPDWKVATVTDETGKTFQEVSINKTNKKGEPFPNFDQIMSGATIEANFWTSGAGKHYLFAPDPKNVSTGTVAPQGGRGGGIAKAQMVKAENIEKAQGNKELGIKTSSTIRMAVDCAVAECGIGGNGLQSSILKWRLFFWENWDMPEDATPPFKN